MQDYVTFEHGFDGTSVMIEPETCMARRAFRYMASGALEWCALSDWREHNVRARFYGFHSRELPSTMTNA